MKNKGNTLSLEQKNKFELAEPNNKRLTHFHR